MTHIVHSPHPILPQQDRKIVDFLVQEKASLLEVLEASGLTLKEPYAAFCDSVFIPKDQYNTLTVSNDSVIAIRAITHGDRGSEIGAMVAMIALAVAAPHLAGAMAPSLVGASGSLTLGGQVLAAGIVLGGSLLINKMVPRPELDTSQPRTENVSPTYSLTAAGNRIRPYEVIPHVIGQHKMYPDTDTRAYTIIGENGDLYLRQTFNFGLADIVISDLKIGDTAIADFDDVQYEVSGSDGRLVLFPSNTDQQSIDIELKNANGWSTQTTVAATTRIEVMITASVFSLDERNGQTVSNTVQIEGEYRVVGSQGAWSPLFNEQSLLSISRATRQPLRTMYGVGVTSGQYDVRIRKRSFDYPVDTQYHYNNVFWTALTSYQNDATDYSGQKRMAVQIKATDQLNGALEQLNAVVSARCPVWNGSTWSTTTTSNPAWWTLYILRGIFDSDGRLIFGLGLPDDRIDIAGIQAWGAWCTTNSLAVNWVVDQNITIETALNTIARCGRATPDFQTGKWGVIWDAQSTVPVQVFSMANILAHSFDIAYLSSQTSDEVVIDFIDSTSWKPDQVRVSVPGVSSPESSAEFSITGITSRAQAGQEANLIAASQTLHRRYFSWEADAEALVCGRGDVIAISHSLLGMESGRLMSGTTSQVVLDHAVDLSGFTTPYIQVRSPDGTIQTRVISSSGTTATINVSAPFTFTAPGTDGLDYIWSIGSGSAPYLLVKIVSIQPLSEFRFRITAREENSQYYSAASGDYTYNAPNYYGLLTPASITDIQITEDFLGDSGLRLNISWQNIQSLGAHVIVEY